MRTPSPKAKSPQGLRSVINATKKLWRQHHLTYDQTRYVAKEVRHALAIERTKIRQRVIARLSREEEVRLITHAYRMKGERGLLIKALFQTGARVSEFVNIKVEDVFFEEQMILIRPRMSEAVTSGKVAGTASLSTGSRQPQDVAASACPVRTSHRG